MQKIAFYIDNMNRGGAQRVMTNLCEYYAKKGTQVILINDYPSMGGKPIYSLSNSIKRVYLQEKYERNPIKNNIVRLMRLRTVLRNEGPDLVLSFLGGPNLRAILATIGLDLKTVVSVRNDPNMEYSKGGIKKRLVQQLFQLVDGCVFQTKDAQAYFTEKVQKKSEIIFNPVNEKFYGTRRSPNAGEIVTAGRMNAQKRHDILIQAFALHEKEHPNSVLYIYGDGPLRSQLETLIDSLQLNEKVCLPGNIPDLEKKLETASAFILSSDYEGMPNALMEAMAAGVPAISTYCPCGGPQMLDGNTGAVYLTECGNVNELAKAMSEIVSDNNLAQKMSVLARKRADLFKPEEVYKQWDKYLSSIVD